MKRLLTLIALISAVSGLSACGTESVAGKPIMQRDDKKMSCEQLQLEINDAEFLRYQARENKGLNFSNIVWPVGYPSTVSSANEAIEITSNRIRYLSNIYRIKKCEPELPDEK